MKNDTKKLPKYSDIIFKTFEDAKKARKILINILNYAKNKDFKQHFISVSDMIYNLDDSGIDYKVIKATPNPYNKDNERYAWFKKPGIYEFKNDHPEEGYIFEDPELI